MPGLERRIADRAKRGGRRLGRAGARGRDARDVCLPARGGVLERRLSGRRHDALSRRERHAADRVPPRPPRRGRAGLRPRRLGRPRETERGPSGGAARGHVRSHLGDAGEVLDARSRQLYRERIRELREQAEEARACNDILRASAAEREIEALSAELKGAFGLRGTPRHVASHVERARVSTTRTVRDAIGGSPGAPAARLPSRATIKTAASARTTRRPELGSSGSSADREEGAARRRLAARPHAVRASREPRLHRVIEHCSTRCNGRGSGALAVHTGRLRRRRTR